MHSVDVTFVLGNRIAFAYTPSCPYSLIRGFWPVAAAGALHVFCAIRPVGVIRPCWICPIAAIDPPKNKNPTIFATFLRLGTLFCSPKAEIGCRTADYLRFCTVIRDRGSPQQSLIAKKLQFEPFFCFSVPLQKVQGGIGEGAAQARRCRMIQVRRKFDVEGMIRRWFGRGAAG